MGDAVNTNEQSPAPVAGDEDARPASEQPVEAIGAGREEIAGPPREPTQTMMDALLYHSSADTTWGDAYTMWTAAHDAWFRDGPAALSLASPEAIGAGRRELLERLEAEVSDETMRALLSCKDVGSGRAHLARILAALSPASPARTPMGDKPEWLYLPEGEKPKDEGWQITHMTASSEEEGKRRIWVRNLTRSVLSAPTPMGGEVEALREAAQRMADDYQVSSNHHPHHVLVQRKDFDDLYRALAASSPSPAQGGAA